MESIQIFLQMFCLCSNRCKQLVKSVELSNCIFVGSLNYKKFKTKYFHYYKIRNYLLYYVSLTDIRG